MKFELVSGLTQVEPIARGVGLRDRRRLVKAYGGSRWRKMKGVTTIRLSDGSVIEAELHWYEAHGIGKKEFKFKRPIDG